MDVALAPMSFLETGGPLLVWTIVMTFVFLECAFIIGLFLPGDSMLLTAGIVISAQGLDDHHIWMLSVGAMLAAIAGNQLGYAIGHRTGQRMHARQGGRYFNTQNLQRVAVHLEKHGFWAVLVARWIPWVRTLCPLVAGAAGMDHKRYTIASTLGAILWAPVLLHIGYYAGTSLEEMRWLRTTVIVGMLVLLVVGTVLGIRHYLQEMSKPEVDVDLPNTPD